MKPPGAYRQSYRGMLLMMRGKRSRRLWVKSVIMLPLLTAMGLASSFGAWSIWSQRASLQPIELLAFMVDFVGFVLISILGDAIIIFMLSNPSAAGRMIYAITRLCSYRLNAMRLARLNCTKRSFFGSRIIALMRRRDTTWLYPFGIGLIVIGSGPLIPPSVKLLVSAICVATLGVAPCQPSFISVRGAYINQGYLVAMASGLVIGSFGMFMVRVAGPRRDD